METPVLKDVANYNYGLEKIFDKAQDFLSYNVTDYVELYVGNASRPHTTICRLLAFSPWHMRGWKQGVRDRVILCAEAGQR